MILKKLLAALEAIIFFLGRPAPCRDFLDQNSVQMVDQAYRVRANF